MHALSRTPCGRQLDGAQCDHLTVEDHVPLAPTDQSERWVRVRLTHQLEGEVRRDPFRASN
jgi:hypothetical protein